MALNINLLIYRNVSYLKWVGNAQAEVAFSSAEFLHHFPHSRHLI